MYKPIYDPEELGRVEPYKTTLSMLGTGKRNAVHASELAKFWGIGCRTVRQIIETLRASGVCIVSDENGYYYPETAEEIHKYINRVKSVINTHACSIGAACALLDEFSNKGAGADVKT